MICTHEIGKLYGTVCEFKKNVKRHKGKKRKESPTGHKREWREENRVEKMGAAVTSGTVWIKGGLSQICRFEDASGK